MNSRFTRYLESIARLNKLEKEGPLQWLFYSGMLFLSQDKWWADFKYRASVHEGVDITWFKTGTTIGRFDDTTRVPAIANGILVNTCPDFLGRTLVVEDHIRSNDTWRVVYCYAHIVPEKPFRQGQLIEQSDCIARVSHTAKNPELPPHLHFSCFEVSKDIALEQLNWELFSSQTAVRMIHPFFL